MATGHSLLHTLLELGHTTSQNLGYVQSSNNNLRYGEETITETNLLELHRRHPAEVKIQSFSKAFEGAQTGADWEWHLIGHNYTLKMRVQAKCVARDGSLHGIQRNSGVPGLKQIELLIQDSKRYNLLPIYCFYSSEACRAYWKAIAPKQNQVSTEYGCLLAPATTVENFKPRKFSSIEKQTIPWHYLCSAQGYSIHAGPFRYKRLPVVNNEVEEEQYLETVSAEIGGRTTKFRLPTIEQLNGDIGTFADMAGITPTDENAKPNFNAVKFGERKIRGIVEIDVSKKHIFDRRA